LNALIKLRSFKLRIDGSRRTAAAAAGGRPLSGIKTANKFDPATDLIIKFEAFLPGGKIH
jgi:hypothetical protein